MLFSIANWLSVWESLQARLQATRLTVALTSYWSAHYLKPTLTMTRQVDSGGCPSTRGHADYATLHQSIHQ